MRPTHFVPKALSFFSHDLDPHYFPNPPGYTYLLYIVFELWFGSSDRNAGVHAPTRRPYTWWPEWWPRCWAPRLCG